MADQRPRPKVLPLKLSIPGQPSGRADLFGTGHRLTEPGLIEFGAEPDGHALHFEIESWARAGDRLSALPYNKLRLAKEIQLNIWSHFSVRAAELAGRPQGGVTIRTRWVPWP